jgi:hypothetical protein
MSQATTSLADLLVLVADQNTLAAVQGLMERRRSLGVDSRFSFEIRPHPEHDPGCLLRAHDFLAPFQRLYGYALVVFDREGCGSMAPRGALENQVEARLAAKGWASRSASVVIDPELENWVWSESPHVDSLLGWFDRSITVREWLRSTGDLAVGESKPTRPKEAMEKILRKTHRPRSSSIYERLARKVGLATCRDPAFLKFKATLQVWFPAS